MSVLSDLDDIVLRSVVNPPLTTKGSELTYAELDGHAVKLYDAVQSIVSGANVTAYDNSKTYDKFSTDIRDRYAGYNNRIWEAAYVGSPSTFSGQTPEDGIYWTQVTLAEMLPDIMKLAEVSESSGVVLKQAELVIPSAQVLTGNSSPVSFGITVPSGFGIDLIGGSITFDYGSSPYATNMTAGVRTVGATDLQLAGAHILNATQSCTRKLIGNSKSQASDTQIIADADIEFYVSGGDPTGGDSDITVKVLYYELDMS